MEQRKRALSEFRLLCSTSVLDAWYSDPKYIHQSSLGREQSDYVHM